MNTRPIPIIMSLSAVGVTCIISIAQGVDFPTFLARLILAVILFYFVGIVVGIFLLNAFGPPRAEGDDDIFDNEIEEEGDEDLSEENEEEEASDNPEIEEETPDISEQEAPGSQEQPADEPFEPLESDEETSEGTFTEDDFSEGIPQENIEDDTIPGIQEN